MQFSKKIKKTIDKSEKMVYNTLELAYANLSDMRFNRQEGEKMTLRNAELGTEYTIKNIVTDDEELNAFLFSLGCYAGEPITVVTRRKSGCVIAIKDARYNIDDQLADAIQI